MFTKKPFSGAHKVVEYLGRYSHRVAITNQRIISIDDTSVIFKYKDYKDGAKSKTMKLTGEDFLQRLSLHFLPPQFRKVRNYGFTANASKAKSLNKARTSLGLKVKELLSRHERKELALIRLFDDHINACPICKKGKMKLFFPCPPNKDPPQELLNAIKNQRKESK